MAWNTNLRWRLPLSCLLLQAALVVLFGVFVRYSPDADAHWIEEKGSGNVSSDLDNEFYYRYPSKSCPPAGPPAAHPTELVPTWPRALPGRTCSAYVTVGHGASHRRRLRPQSCPTRHSRSPASGDHAGEMARCVLFPREKVLGKPHRGELTLRATRVPQPPCQEPYLMFSKDLRAVLVTPQGVTLAPLSSCAHALCQQPQGGLVGLSALLLGEVYRTMAPTFSWEEHPKIPRVQCCG